MAWTPRKEQKQRYYLTRKSKPGLQAKWRQYGKDAYHLRRSLNLCVTAGCDQDPTPGRVRCPSCQEKHNQENRKWRQKRALRSSPIAA